MDREAQSLALPRAVGALDEDLRAPLADAVEVDLRAVEPATQAGAEVGGADSRRRGTAGVALEGVEVDAAGHLGRGQLAVGRVEHVVEEAVVARR